MIFCHVVPLRDHDRMYSQAWSIGEHKTENQSQIQRDEGEKYGISFYSELNTWPGFSLTYSITNDYMHAGIFGEDKKHFLCLMRKTQTQVPTLWNQFCIGLNAFLSINRLDKVRPFSSEAGFCILTTHAMMTAFKYSQPILKKIITSEELSEHLELWGKNVQFIQIMTSSDISSADLDNAALLFHQIKHQGAFLYTNQDHERSVSWITINSHVLSHTKMNTQRWGCPVYSWVFAFESQLGILKRYLDLHRNGVSEGFAMLKYFWRLVNCSYLLGKICTTPIKYKTVCQGDVVMTSRGRILIVKTNLV